MKQLPRIKDLDLVFTYAQSADKRSTNLLFTSLAGHTEIFLATTIESIVADPLYQEIMGKNSILFPYETTPFPVLLATTEFMEQVAARTETAKEGEAVVICREGAPPETIDLHTMYYGCQLPQKLILGCLECVNNPSQSKGCPLRQASSQALSADFQGTAPEELVNFLKSRKSKIDGFTYLSPVLTTHEHFSKTLRTIEEHDFSYVEERAAIRESIIDARVRLNAVKKNICTHCYVAEYCHREFDHKNHRSRIRNCKGRYPETEEEAIRIINKTYPPPMTFEQMSVLLANSGELRKRYNRRICYATFTDNYGELVFAIVSRRYTHIKHICKSYEEAVAIIEKHNGFLYKVVRPVTPKMYALLREAVAHRNSPVNRTRWHTTQYPRLHILPTYGDGVEISYTYNSHSYKELPWSLEARCLGVFLEHYYDLDTLNRIPFTDDDIKPKRGRRSGKLP